MTTRQDDVGDDVLDAALVEADRLRLQVSALLDTHRQLSTRLVAADTRSGDLMKLLIAVRVLIESRDAAAALESLEDILVNVVGTDDFVIYALDPREKSLLPIAGVGESLSTSGPLPLYQGPLGAILRGGELVVARGARPGHSHEGLLDIAAVVPLKVLDRVVGAIVIARLLPHRELLDACDREVLGLLGVYAATTIIAAGRRASWRELPRDLR